MITLSRWPASFLSIILAAAAFAQAPEQAAPFNDKAARSQLGLPPKTKPGQSLTKGWDPEIRRSYTKDAVTVFRRSGATVTKPLVEVPLLFRKNTDELLDDVSRENVAKLARLLQELAGQNGAIAIEGHASAEGDPARNRELSRLRALRIQALLREAGVPAALLTRVQGCGSDHARHPASAAEAQLQQDRRVLVVRDR